MAPGQLRTGIPMAILLMYYLGNAKALVTKWRPSGTPMSILLLSRYSTFYRSAVSYDLGDHVHPPSSVLSHVDGFWGSGGIGGGFTNIPKWTLTKLANQRGGLVKSGQCRGALSYIRSTYSRKCFSESGPWEASSETCRQLGWDGRG